jgi:hypothetical protein
MISKSLISILCFVLVLIQVDSTCINNIQVQLVIESANTVSSKSYTIASGSNVIQLLEIDHILDTTYFNGLGLYVNAIDGEFAYWVPNQQFWELLVNSRVSDLGASNYILKANDVITWRIVTYDPITMADLK